METSLVGLRVSNTELSQKGESAVQLTVNGSARAVPDRTTVRELLEQFDLATERVAVECNGQIVPSDGFAERRLQDGDVVEIVRFVGGG